MPRAFAALAAAAEDPKRVNAEERDRSVEQGQALQWKAQDELNQAGTSRLEVGHAGNCPNSR